jgi:hypothetical protein
MLVVHNDGAFVLSSFEASVDDLISYAPEVLAVVAW